MLCGAVQEMHGWQTGNESEIEQTAAAVCFVVEVTVSKLNIYFCITKKGRLTQPSKSNRIKL
jgi:hypothetical protein